MGHTCLIKIFNVSCRSQLQAQADGLSGHFLEFWAPINNSTWLGGNNYDEDWVEIFPYFLQGYVPQAILLRDKMQLQSVETM